MSITAREIVGAADIAFPRWDRDANGYVSKEEMAEVVREFFHSSDPDAPGNLLFGPLAPPPGQEAVEA